MLERFEEQTGQPSSTLLSKPRLLARLAWPYECFIDLSVDRSYTHGQPLRLSTSQIKSYFDAFEMQETEEFEAFYYKIRQIDRVWSEAVSKHSKVQQEQTKSNQRPRQRR
jgi:hypothetical protein